MDPIEFLALDPHLERERRRKSHSNSSSANSSPAVEHKKKEKSFPFLFLQRRNSLSKVIATPIAPLFSLLSLQPELILHVISFMEAKQLLNISQTCKMIHDIYTMNAHFLWRGVCGRKFGLSDDVLFAKRRELHWKTYYAEKVALAKPASFSWTLMNDSIKERPVPRMCHSGASLLPTSAPLTASSSSCAFLQEDGDGWQESPGFDRVVYIGGQSGQTSRFDDVYLFNGQKFQRLNDTVNSNQEAENKPPTFARHTSVSIGNKVYSFGGFDGTAKYFGVAVLDMTNMTWSYPQTTGEPPKLKTNHATAVIGSKMYIYGGNRTEEGQYSIFDEFHVLDTATMCWSQIKASAGQAPGPKVAHKLIAVGKRLYLFGGGVWSPQSDWVERSKKIHVFDTETSTWSCPAVIGEDLVRASSFTVPMVFSTFIFFFGGQSIQDGNEINDLVSFDTVSLSWQRHEAVAHKDNPGQRSVATLNLQGEHAWLFAGSDSFDLSNSVHRLSHPIFKKRKFTRPHA
jgi:hypothetical protein